MRKLILLMLLLCAVIASGCSENVPPKEDAKNAATAAVQEKKDISFIVYRAASDGSEKLLPEKITMKDNGKSLPENALIALVTTKPQDAKMDDVVPIGTKVRSLKIEQDGEKINLIESDGRGNVRMHSSTCKNQLCVEQGWLGADAQSDNGRWIVCLPNGVSITVSGDENENE